MEDDVEFAASERAQVAHIPADVVELRAAPARERADRRELARADVEEGRVGAELREEDGVPAATAGEREDAGALQRDPGEAAARELREEAALAGAIARRCALRARVRDAGSREPVPHPLVVRRDLVDGDAPRHASIV